MMRRIAIVLLVVAASGVFSVLGAGAEEAVPFSVLDDIVAQSRLTGNWFGTRDRMEDKGVTVDANLTQITQGVVTGGKDASWRYGGRGNLTGNLDTQKLGLWPGGFLTVELEWNWNDSVNGSTGALMPANTNQLFPVATGDNVGLPNLSFAQFLSPYAGVTLGKFDTMSADTNEFAHGKGDVQFLNTALSINPVALSVPYSTLGAGAIVLPTKDPHHAIITALVLSASGDAVTAGFDDIASDNLVFAAEGRLRTDFFGLTGHQLLGGLYSNRKYTSLDQRLGQIIENRDLRANRGTWAVYYNFDQFVYEIDRDAGRGVGLFGRFGASEGDPIPAQYFFSFGVGGKGAVPGRELDRFGIGSYYIIVENPQLQTPFTTRSFLGDEWGFEAFYNIALTPWMLLTPDIQVIGPSQKRRITGPVTRKSIDTATVIGLRLQLIF